MESGVDKSMLTLEKHLLSAVEETMENMVFEEVESDTETEWAKNDLIWARLPVLNPVKGEVILLISRSVATSVTKDIYTAEEESITEEIILDAVSELINTLTGCFIKRLIKEDEDFELGLPESNSGVFIETDTNFLSQTYRIGEKILRVIVGGEIMKLAE